MIERISPYSNLTDTDNICVFFIFICKPESCTPDSQFRDVLLEVIIKNNILHRFDTSQILGKIFSQKWILKKKARL